MQPLTLKTPKPLLEVAGQPLIVWHLEKLAAAGIQKVVINTSYLGEQIHQALGQGDRWQLEISYSHEHSPLETGGGLYQALPLLGSQPFLLINGDVWCASLPELDLPEEQLARLFLVANPEHNPAGDFYFNPESRQLSNQPAPGLDAFTFSGISLLRPEIFTSSYLQQAYPQPPQPGEAFALAPLLRLLVEQQRADAQFFADPWVDVGTPARLAQLNGRLA